MKNIYILRFLFVIIDENIERIVYVEWVIDFKVWYWH